MKSEEIVIMFNVVWVSTIILLIIVFTTSEGRFVYDWLLK